MISRKTKSLFLGLGTFAFLSICRIQAIQTKKLSSGYEMPVIGLGTWQMKPEFVDMAVTTALDNGYRHIDTAYVYGNEKAIGDSLKKWFDKGGKREEMFITTKLPPIGNRPADVENFLNQSLKNLGIDYVDLFLIHKPYTFIQEKNSSNFAKDSDGNVVLDFDSDPLEVWKIMEKQVKEGRARSIGLSNFNESQIIHISNHSEIKPSNLQIELHVYNQQKPIRELCEKLNISVTGYSTLGSPGTVPEKKEHSVLALPKLLSHPKIQKIAEAHNKTTAQILLRHSIQDNVIVIPKSTKPERIKENFDIFDFLLTDDEMNEINNLDMGELGRMFTFLNVKGVEKHPEYPFTSHIKPRKGAPEYLP